METGGKMIIISAILICLILASIPNSIMQVEFKALAVLISSIVLGIIWAKEQIEEDLKKLDYNK